MTLTLRAAEVDRSSPMPCLIWQLVWSNMTYRVEKNHLFRAERVCMMIFRKKANGKGNKFITTLIIFTADRPITQLLLCIYAIKFRAYLPTFLHTDVSAQWYNQKHLRWTRENVFHNLYCELTISGILSFFISKYIHSSHLLQRI